MTWPAARGPHIDHGEGGSPGSVPAPGLVDALLQVLRRHLGMEVAFVGRVQNGHRLVEYADSDEEFPPFAVGANAPLGQTLCGPILSGELPPVVPDARAHPAVAHLAVTRKVPVAALVSAPIETPDGEQLGMLCCFSRIPGTDLDENDTEMLRAFARIVGAHLQPLAAEQAARRRIEHRIGEVLDHGGPAIALQPIVSLRTGAVTGYEALARFPAHNGWGVEDWFHAAVRVGMSGALEAAAVHAALGHLRRIPPHLTLAVNVSVTALTSNPSIAKLFVAHEPARLVLELTEQHRIDDVEVVHDALKQVRTAGVAVALDDTGTGYSGLERVLAVRPEILKLDRSLVQGVSSHPGRQAICEAMVGFTRRMEAGLIAEGVETSADLDTLADLGIPRAQGYLLGRPRPAHDVLAGRADAPPTDGRLS